MVRFNRVFDKSRLCDFKLSFHLALQLSNFLQSRIMSFEFISWLQFHFFSWKRLNNHPTLSFIVGMDSSSVIVISSFVFGLSLPFMLRFSDQNSLSLFTFPLIFKSTFKHWYKQLFWISSPLGSEKQYNSNFEERMKLWTRLIFESCFLIKLNWVLFYCFV